MQGAREAPEESTEMKVFDTPDIRNVALLGHGDAGKTSLAAGLLFAGGAVNRIDDASRNRGAICI